MIVTLIIRNLESINSDTSQESLVFLNGLWTQRSMDKLESRDWFLFLLFLHLSEWYEPSAIFNSTYSLYLKCESEKKNEYQILKWDVMVINKLRENEFFFGSQVVGRQKIILFISFSFSFVDFYCFQYFRTIKVKKNIVIYLFVGNFFHFFQILLFWRKGKKERSSIT